MRSLSLRSSVGSNRVLDPTKYKFPPFASMVSDHHPKAIVLFATFLCEFLSNLCAIIDIYSRYIVGWIQYHGGQLLYALETAVERYGKPIITQKAAITSMLINICLVWMNIHGWKIRATDNHSYSLEPSNTNKLYRYVQMMGSNYLTSVNSLSIYNLSFSISIQNQTTFLPAGCLIFFLKTFY